MSLLRQRRRLLVMAAPLALAIAATALAAAGDLGPRQRVSSTGPDGNPSFSSFQANVVYNPDRNEYLAVWPGETATDNEVEIFGRLLEPGGVPIGGQFRISTMGPDADINYGAFNPAATYNSTTHEYLVAWWGDDNTVPLVDEETEIFAQRLSATGSEVGPDDQRISAMGPDGNTSYDTRNPTATYNPTANEYLVAWSGDDNTVPLVDEENEIFAQRLSATGLEVGTDDQRISAMGPDGNSGFDAVNPWATYNPTANEYLIAWQGDDDTAPLVNGETEIFAQRLSATGAEAGTDDQRISALGPDGDTNYEAFFPTVVSNPTANEYLVAWEGDDNAGSMVNNEFEILAQRLSATGVEVGTDDQRISTMGTDATTTNSAASPAVTYNPTANEYLIAWYGDDDTAPLVTGEQEVFAQRLAAGGAEEGPDDLRISTMGPDGNANFDGRSPSVAYGVTANEYVIVWDGDDNTAPLVDNESEIFARGLAAPDPPADSTPDPTPPELPPADTKLDGAAIELAKKIVIKGKELKIPLVAGCAEACNSTASGSISVKAAPERSAAKAKRYPLASAVGSSTAGAKTTLTLKLKGSKSKRRKATRRIVTAIGDEAKAKALISVIASDAAGNSATATGSAKLKAKQR